MDTVRLAIVYETGQAASRLQQLDRQLRSVHTRTVGAQRGAALLRGGLQSLAFQATGVSGPLGKISTGLLSIGAGSTAVLGVTAGVAVMASAFHLLTGRAEELAKANDKLADSYANVAGASAIQAFISAQKDLTEAQEKQDRRIGLNLASKSFGLAGGIVRFLFGATDADLTDQSRNIATMENLVDALHKKWQDTVRAIRDAARATQNLHELTKSYKDLASKLEGLFNPHELTKSPQEGGRKIGDVINFHDLTKETKDLQLKIDELGIGIRHTSQLMENALYTMSNAVEDFVITGTFAFTEFLNNILRLLIRDASDRFISNLLGSGLGLLGGGGGGGGGGTDLLDTGAPPFGPGSSQAALVTNVNFNVSAVDAQSTAQFFERNSAQIAAEVTRQADRSRSIRKRFWRG